MNKNQQFSAYRYLLQTIDPVHIGTGGMRLGRVDNSIVREPGTRLPKIPGTSLSGAIRHYASYRYGKKLCAGQKEHCGLPTCPICYTFGSISGVNEQQKSFSGVVSIGDARIILFPVYSVAGPVWVTCPSVLEDFGIKDQIVSENKAKFSSGLSKYQHINLNWLMVEKEDSFSLNELPCLSYSVNERIVLISNKIFSQVVNSNLEVRTSVSIDPETGAAEEHALFTYEAIPRATFMWMDVVVDDYRDTFPAYDKLQKWENILFDAKSSDEVAFINLQKVGGFLRKYNAPMENINRDYENEFNNAKNRLLNYIREEKSYYENATLHKNKKWNSTRTAASKEDTPSDVVAAGLEWGEYLGIGGMGTRGFGRIRNVDCHEVS